MKKILSICIIFIITLSQLSYVNIAYAANYTAEEVADLILYDIDKEATTIRKMDALIAVLNAIGMSNYDSAYFNAIVEDTEWSDDKHVLPDNTYAYLSGYKYLAMFEDIMFGEQCTLENGRRGWIYEPLSNATSSTCIAFMVRAMNDWDRLDLCNVDLLYKTAKTCGLLKPEDAFYNNLDYVVSVQEFRELLIRFLNQKAYKYYGTVAAIAQCEIQTDARYTYLELLNNMDTSWLNKAPIHEARVVVVNGLEVYGPYYFINIENYITDNNIYFPFLGTSRSINGETGGNFDINEDGSYTVNNGMGDTSIIYPGSDIIVKNGVEYKLSAPCLDEQEDYFGVTEEALQLIYNNKVEISYYVDKTYFHITVGVVD